MLFSLPHNAASCRRGAVCIILEKEFLVLIGYKTGRDLRVGLDTMEAVRKSSAENQTLVK
jgi:hypothetical protein